MGNPCGGAHRVCPLRITTIFIEIQRSPWF
jgi:hypothetical protein